MSEAEKPLQTAEQSALSHRRILIILAVCVVAGTILGFVFVSVKFGFGFLIGGILSFVNYYWLKISLRKIFENVESGEKPRVSATRYLLRYLAFGVLLAIIYLTKVFPVTAVISGLASFAFAILIEGFIRLFSTFFKK